MVKVMGINFDVTTIPHEHHRYPTVGDYTTDGFDNVHFRVSILGNWRFELLVAVHEIVEKYLTMEAGVKEEDIDAFDIIYEANRKPDDDSEPGDHLGAPYYKQHQIATRVERFLAGELGVDWDVYEKVINSL